MTIEERVSLATVTTFQAGGTARYVATCTTVEEIRSALAFAKEHGIAWYLLGEGSNVLPPDQGYDGVVILNRIPGLSFEETESGVVVVAGAGVSWDTLVREAASRGLWGIENLAGIPGTAGAAPVQNIGAYGMELASSLVFVEVLDTTTGSVSRLTPTQCALGYRDSRFKKELGLIVLKIGLVLKRDGAPKIEYGDLLRAKEAGKDLSTPEAIGNVVREVRAGKFPDLATHGTAGSFFKNPILTEAAYATLSQTYGDIPRFAHPQGVKIPLAFLLDRALSLRGFRMGNAWLFGSQPLVLVLDRGGTAEEIETLAQHVEARVKEVLGISIEREVRSMPKK